jgi:protein SCO1
MKHKTIWLVLLLSLTGICAASAWKLLRQELIPTGELPIYGTVPEFSLIERSGRRVQLDDLKGTVWVADFIFAGCHDFCPEMTIRMNALQASLTPDNHVCLVSFSVDPEHDTPQVLSDYAKKNNAGQRWLFLTGNQTQIYQLASRGFFLPVEPEREQQQILHSQKFVLIDQQGQIRGYYDSEMPQAHDQILVAIQSLLASES